MNGRRSDAHTDSGDDHPSTVGHFTSAQARQRFLDLLDSVLDSWPTRTDASLETSFGETAYSLVAPNDPVDPPLVLLQGGNSTIAGWSHLIEPLSRTRTVIVIDTIWEAGRSTQLVPMPNGEHAALWLNEVLDGLGAEAVHLVGYSYGAWAALIQAVRSPDRLATVTAIDPPGAITGIPLRAWMRMIRLMTGGPNEALSFLTWLRNGQMPSSPMKELLLSSTTDFVKRGSPLPRKLSRGDWSSISVPVQVIIAGRSQFVPRRAVRRLGRLASSIPVHVIDGVGHAVLSDAPRQTAILVDDFVSRLRGT